MTEYFQRIGQDGAAPLDVLVNAHVCSIPFENLSVLAGMPVRLDLPSLWDKLVLGGRGGYCFEQNTLIEHVLGQLGYLVEPLAARVRRGASEIRPHTHKLLRVEWQGEAYLVDVGFGGEGPSYPLPWREGAWELVPGVVHRLAREDDLWVLQCQHDGGEWVDLYATDCRRQYPVDFEMANHFTSTYPSSLFRNSLLVGLHQKGGYKVLFDRKLRLRADGVTVDQELAGEAQVREVLRAIFGLTPLV